MVHIVHCTAISGPLRSFDAAKSITFIRNYGLQSPVSCNMKGGTRETESRMHTKYSGRTAIATIVGMTAVGWAGVALMVQMVLKVVA